MKIKFSTRCIACWLVFFLVFTMFPASLFAAAQTVSVKLELSEINVKPGDNINVRILLSNPIPISTLQYKLKFDAEALTYVGRQYGPWVAASEFIAICNVPTNPGDEVRLGGYDGSGNGDYIINGLLITLTFRVKETATAGYKPFNIIDFDFANGDGSIDYGNGKGVSDIALDVSEATGVAFQVEGKLYLKVDHLPTTNEYPYGTPLSVIAINGGAVAPEDNADTTAVTGVWAWKDDIIIPPVGVSQYLAIFTPDAACNQYEPLETNVTVYITPKPVTVVVDTASKVFGQPNPTFTGKCDALVPPDTIETLGLTLISEAYQNSDAGLYDVTASVGAGVNGNYIVSIDGSKKLEIVKATAQSIKSDVPSYIFDNAYATRNCSDMESFLQWARLPVDFEVITNSGNWYLTITWTPVSPISFDPKGDEYILYGILNGNENIDANGLKLILKYVIDPLTLPDITPLQDATVLTCELKAATANDLSALLPINGSTIFNGETVEYSINWDGGETLDLTDVGASEIFTGTVSYPNLQSWITPPLNNNVSRKITVINKDVVPVTLDKPTDILYGQEVIIPNASAPDAGVSPKFIYTFSGTPYDGSTIDNPNEKPTKPGEYTVTATLDDITYAGSASQSFIISRKPLTATVNAVSKIYGEANPVFDATYSGFIDGEDESILKTAIIFDTDATEASDVGFYDIIATAGAGANGNYEIIIDGINKLEVIQATAVSIATLIPETINCTAYDVRGCTNTEALRQWAMLPLTIDVITNGGNASMPIVWAPIPPTIVNPKGGDYILLGMVNGNANINANGITKYVTIKIAPILLQNPLFNDAMILFGDNNSAKAADLESLLPKNGEIVLEGESFPYTIDWDGGETLDLTSIGTYETFTGTVSYDNVKDWLTLPSNYIVTRKITVTDKLTVTVLFDRPDDAIYGQEVIIPAASAPDVGISAHFIYTYSGTSYNGQSIADSIIKPILPGEYIVTATLDDPMYTGSADQPFIIARKPIIATVNSAIKKYGEINPAFIAIYDGLVYGETEACFTTALTLDTVATSESPVGRYDVISLTGIGINGNYIVTLDGAQKLTIIKKPVTIVADDANRDYLAVNPIFTFTYDSNDLVGNDTVDDLSVSLSTIITNNANAGLYSDAITGVSTSVNYNVTIVPGSLIINKIDQLTPIIINLSKISAIMGVTTSIKATATGGDGVGAYEYSSLNTSVAIIDQNTGEISLVGVGQVGITATKKGDINYNAQLTDSAPTTLTVIDKITLTATNTVAIGEYLDNAKNQAKVNFGPVTRDGETNDFKLTVTGTQRLDTYSSTDINQGDGCWVGVLIGKIDETNITNLYVKTMANANYIRLTEDDIKEAIYAGSNGDTFVWWINISDINPGSEHVIYVSTDGTDTNAAKLSITFIPAEVVPNYILNVLSGTGGSITGGGEFVENTSVTVIATPINGYAFDGWYENNMLISTTNPFTFIINNHRTLHAVFKYIGGSTSGNRQNSGGGGAGTVIPDDASGKNKKTYIEKIITPEQIPVGITETTLFSKLDPILNKNGETGYITGYPDGTVRPNDFITRYETAVMFYNLIIDINKNEYSNFANQFSDTKADEWYSEALGCLVMAGIIDGYEDGTFRGDNLITRAEFVKIAIQFDNMNISGIMPFNDVTKDHWAYDYILSAYNNGWIVGYPDGSFGVDINIIRAEAFTLTNRILGWSAPSLKNYDPPQDLSNSEWFYDEVILAMYGV